LTLGDVFRTAIRPIRTRSLESALIVVAVALGVGVVTAMLALILNGLEQERAMSESLYARELVLVSRDQDTGGFFEAGQINPVISIGNSSDKPFKFDQADLETVRRACPAIKYAYVTQYAGVAETSSGSDDPSRMREVQLIGVSREYIDAAGLQLIAGFCSANGMHDNASRKTRMNPKPPKHQTAQRKPVSPKTQKHQRKFRLQPRSPANPLTSKM
jgi:hypothetical protein